jgi:hypothetical protein
MAKRQIYLKDVLVIRKRDVVAMKRSAEAVFRAYHRKVSYAELGRLLEALCIRLGPWTTHGWSQYR